MARGGVTTVSIPRAKWAVLWLKKGEIVWIDCEHDFSRALEIYNKARDAGRKGVTLRSCNVGFPPPRKITHAEAYKVVKKRVKGRVKRFKQKVVTNRMSELNLKGWWWCPYCIKLRKFEKVDGFEIEGIWVGRPSFCCPMCEISAQDHHVRLHNPQAQMLEYRQRNKRSGKKRR